MKAPSKLKIGGREFVREDLLKKAAAKAPFKSGKSVVAGVAVAATKPALVGKLPQRTDLEVVPMKVSKMEIITAKVVIPKELWAPIFKKIGQDKALIKELKKLLKAGEPEPLMDFAKKNDLDYSSLRKIMSLVNPDLHVGETLSVILAKAVRALKDAGVVDPIKIEQGALWKAWLKAVDEEARG